jgi:hypothetical protein
MEKTKSERRTSLVIRAVALASFAMLIPLSRYEPANDLPPLDYDGTTIHGS